MEEVAYEASRYDQILSLHESSEFFNAKNGAALTENVFKAIILDHGVASLFGVGLIHRHFPIASNAQLVEKDGTSCAWECKSGSRFGRKIVPTSWLAAEEKIYPYEFMFVPYQQEGPPELAQHPAFVKSFFSAVVQYGLENSIGLRRLPYHDCKGVLECTEGNVNINFPADQVFSPPSKIFYRF